MKKINQESAHEGSHFVRGGQGMAAENVTIDQRLELCTRDNLAERTADRRAMWTTNR